MIIFLVAWLDGSELARLLELDGQTPQPQHAWRHHHYSMDPVELSKYCNINGETPSIVQILRKSTPKSTLMVLMRAPKLKYLPNLLENSESHDRCLDRSLSKLLEIEYRCFLEHALCYLVAV